MEQALWVAVALLLGAGVAYGLARRSARSHEGDLSEARLALQAKSEKLARAEATLEATEKRLLQVVADREALKESFGALAAEQLKSNRDDFMKQATERFEKSEQQHKGELEKRHEAIEKEFKGINESLAKFKELQDDHDIQRVKAFSELGQQMVLLAQQTEKLGESTTGLSTVLRGSSQSRGKWGEMALRNIAEAAGMTEHCDFSVQLPNDSGGRPDLVVCLPGNAKIPVDAKVPYSDYDRLLEATDSESRDLHLKKHGDTVRATMLDLAKRDYAKELGGEIDFTVMFIPIESVASAAFTARPGLQEEAIENRVLIATPVTLIALLRTVAIYWRQEKMARNAREVWNEAKELHRRLSIFHAHLAGVGAGLERAVKQFNRAVGSYESRVLPQGRRIDELSGDAGNLLPEEKSLFVESQVTQVQATPEEEDDG